MTPIRECRTRFAWSLVAFHVGAAVACAPPRETAQSGPERIPNTSPGADGGAALIAGISAAAASRSSALIPEAAYTFHDVRVRRAAVRTLSRTGDGNGVDRLEKGLADEDGQVVAWSAYGLGLSCRGRETALVRALVARGASLGSGEARAPVDRFALAPLDAISDALARCGTPEAEQTLRGWLDGERPRATEAALALSRLAARRHHLDDSTTVALLEAAGRSPPNDEALASFTHLEALPPPTQRRLLDIATRQIARGGSARPLAIRALGVAGVTAARPLSGVLGDTHFSASERSLAAAALGRLGAEGTAALAEAVSAMVRGANVADDSFLSATFAPLSAALTAMVSKAAARADPAPSATALAGIAAFAIPERATPAVRRRLVSLRCNAAVVLAGARSQTALLAHCDPNPHGRTGALATLKVLGRGLLVSARFEGWKALVDSADPAVRRAAIALIPEHAEMPPVAAVLARALGASEPGVVAEAARVLATTPDRSLGEHETGGASADPASLAAPARAVVEALAKAFDRVRPPDQVETSAALVRAAARLGVLSLKPRVEHLCADDNVTVRRAAEDALRALGSPNAVCEAPKKTRAVPLTSSDDDRSVSLTFVTDSGRLGLTLNPALAPLSTTRIANLARAGFYDGLPIQRVIPGFVAQLGDPIGDGYGGSGKAPLPSETSPLEFGAWSVGIAVGGRDTGSSQIFVTLSPDPSLYGDYPLLGWADPEWANAAEGDVVRSVEVKRQ